MLAGFCAPMCFSVKKGPSRKMPSMRAPRKSSSRRWSASHTLAHAASISSAGWVSVVGTHEVVPRRARASDASFTPSGSQSMTSWPAKPCT